MSSPFSDPVYRRLNAEVCHNPLDPLPRLYLADAILERWSEPRLVERAGEIARVAREGLTKPPRTGLASGSTLSDLYGEDYLDGLPSRVALHEVAPYYGGGFVSAVRVPNPGHLNPALFKSYPIVMAYYTPEEHVTYAYPPRPGSRVLPGSRKILLSVFGPRFNNLLFGQVMAEYDHIREWGIDHDEDIGRMVADAGRLLAGLPRLYTKPPLPSLW